MIAVDTSVVVAAFASWHESHETARAAVDRGAGLPSHAALESYSVLTRLPPPHRAPADVVLDFLRERFDSPFLELPAGRFPLFLQELGARGVTGGATYDALIGTVALGAGAELLTLDRRAAVTYERLGAATVQLG